MLVRNVNQDENLLTSSDFSIPLLLDYLIGNERSLRNAEDDQLFR